MQAGFAMLCAGSVRKKNTHNTMLKNLLDACGAAIAYFSVGYAFAFGGDATATGTTFIGTENFFGTGDIHLPTFFFQYTFAAASVTIVAGSLAEVRFVIDLVLDQVKLSVTNTVRCLAKTALSNGRLSLL